MRVIIDTNLWISFLIGKSLNGMEIAIISSHIMVLFSEESFAELIDVLQRPKFKKYFSAKAIEDLISLLYQHVEWVDVDCHIDECRDEKDNFLLALAVSGNADYLITGDEDLLILNPFRGTHILTFRDFQETVLSEF